MLDERKRQDFYSGYTCRKMVDMEESASSCCGGACDERTRLSYRGGVRDESGRLLAGK